MERYVLPAASFVLVVLGVWFAFRQNRILPQVAGGTEPLRGRSALLPPHGLAAMAGSALLIVLAVMLAGLFGMGILDKLDELRDLGPLARNGQRQLTDEERAFLTFGINYVLILLLVLVLTMGVAVVDLMAIRRYGMRHRRRLRKIARRCWTVNCPNSTMNED